MILSRTDAGVLETLYRGLLCTSVPGRLATPVLGVHYLDDNMQFASGCTVLNRVCGLRFGGALRGHPGASETSDHLTVLLSCAPTSCGVLIPSKSCLQKAQETTSPARHRSAC